MLISEECLSKMAEIPVEKRDLHKRELSELAEVLEDGLKRNFATASVSVVQCPDLSEQPWTLASQGICGSPRLADVGGVPYLFPLPQKDKKYSLTDVAKMVDLPNSLVIGAGAGSSHFVGVNCELMPNMVVSEGGVNRTFATKTVQKDEKYETIPYQCADCGPLANLFFSKGESGKVLEIKAKERIGEDNFVSCMRKALLLQYGENPVGLGGVFQIKSGKAKLHVMPDFSSKPIKSEQEINQWLKFFEMSSPLICLSVFITTDPGLDLRLEHTHCFSHHGDGGHYHYDTTPDQVEYIGYYAPAECIYRVDRPKETHQMGRN